ncbi:MAG: right-handed parallel beta-helix repeat-containing protein [Bacteroidia bacterium]|nr:right-handed parallel beta-helix repeat-containing protein [Bacteroidia bacterium]
MNCEIAHTGAYGIWLRKGCADSRLEQCHLHDLGAGGVKIGNTSIPGNEADLTHHITLENSIIHGGGKVLPCAVGVIIFHAHDNQILHNDVADFRYTAVSVGWVWGYNHSPAKRNLIAYNHLHHIGWGELSDMGGVYTLGPSEGTIVRNNVIHHIYAHGYGGWGLYADQGSTGIVFENNLVYACKSAGFHQHFGKENIVRNNIFALNQEAQVQLTRPESHRSFSFVRNIVYADGGSFYRDMEKENWKKAVIELDYNWFWNAQSNETQPLLQKVKSWQQTGKDQHSLVADPRFINPQAYDFRLKKASQLKRSVLCLLITRKQVSMGPRSGKTS